MRVISECDISLDWNLLNQIGWNLNSERGLYIRNAQIVHFHMQSFSSRNDFKINAFDTACKIHCKLVII